MNRVKARLLQLELVLVDVVTTGAAFLLAYWIRGERLSAGFGEIYPLERYLGIAAAALLSVPVIFMLLEVYEADPARLQKTLLSRDMGKLLQGMLLVYVFLSVLVFSLKLHYVSRLLVVLFVFLDLLLLVWVRLQLWPILYRRAHREPLRVLIVGSGQKAREIASILTSRRGVGISFLGFVVEHGSILDRLDGQPVLGSLTELEAILNRQVVDEVLVALPEKSPIE
ncbi:MAG: nucleoside-diphosphate sugar epimerase/dehydratase, partial [Vicinamibacteria bacterium]